MPLLDEIRKHRGEILKLAEESGLTDVRIFGSVARGEEREDSDIDILVNRIDNLHIGLQTFTLPVALEEMFNRRVDFIFEKGLNKHIKNQVLQEAVPI